MNNHVYALALDSSGNLYAGGRFTSAGGVAANRIARWDGDSWNAIDTGMTAGGSTVYALALDDNDNLYAGGDFIKAGGIGARYIVRWDGSSWSYVGSLNDTVNALVMDGSGNLYAGGEFTSAGSRTVNHIARWDGSRWNALGTGALNTVTALAVDGSDNLYAAGNFMGELTGVAGIARWDGSNWSVLGSIQWRINALAADSSGNLYVGGNFTTANGVSANRIAHWDGSSWSALGTGMDDGVGALALDGNGNLYAGGEFATADGVVTNRIARWDDSSWSALSSPTGSGMNGAVYALAPDGSGNLYAGGSFTNAGGVSANRIARWNGSSWSALGSGMDGAVLALALDGSGNLYAGGNFSIAGGVSANSIAHWDGSNWNALGTDGYVLVYDLALDGSGNLYAGGTFSSLGGVTGANYIARWDSSSWSALGTGMNSRVFALAVDGSGNLYAGGEFSSAGGVAANHIARWNGSSWSSLGTGMNDTVRALTLNGSDHLYAGGDFATAGGVAANHIARWNGSSWGALGTGMDHIVSALAVDGSGNLLVGGSFTTAGGVTANRIASWDGSSWGALGTGTNGSVHALAVNGSDHIYAGGRFTSAGGKISAHTAKWIGPTNVQTITFASLPNKNPADEPFPLVASSDSGLAVSFTVISGPAFLTDNLLTLTGEGTVVVEASQPGDENYLEATPVTRSFSVTKASQAITFGSLPNKTFGDDPFPLVATSNSGLPVAFSVKSGPATISANLLTLTGAGTVSLEASQPGDDRYLAAAPVTRSFSVAKATATVALDAPDVAFDGTPKAAAASTTPADLQVNMTYNGSSTAPSDAGIYDIVATVIDPNYEGSASGSRLVGYTLGTTASQGSVAASPLLAIYEPGASVTLTGTGDPGFHFRNWTGDVPAESQLSNPLTLTMDGHRSVAAIFNDNTGGPTDLSVNTDWFYDNVPVGTSVAKLEALDPDVEDIMTYTLVAGSGDTDNAKFTIEGDELRSAVTFNYHLQRTLSIRVRVTDIGGLSVERAFSFNLVPATPAGRFELRGVFPSSPSYVNVAFQLTDPNGRGIDIPSSLFDQETDIFQVREEGTTISPTESFLQVGKMDDFEDPVVLRTVILLDNSSSVGTDLLKVREAASALVDQILPQQEMAVYSFSGELTELQSFTRDKTALKEAINGMSLGAATTDLNRSISLTLDTWNERFDETGIETGFLVVFTDGVDTTGQVSTQAVLDKRDDENKRIFMIGLGNETDPEGLDEMGNAGSWPIDEFGELENAFSEVQQNIESLDGSFYWVNYASPRRGDAMRSLTISLKGNTYTGADSVLSAQFSSAGFTDVERGVVVNRSVDRTEGVSSLVIAPDASDVVRAFTILPLVEDGAAFSWTLDDPSLATLTSLEEDDSRIRIVPDGREGTTNLTVVDTANTSWAELLGLNPATYTRTITLVIGSEADLAIWAADAGLTGTDAEPDAIPHGDGVTNLLKFAFNMDASRADRSQLVAGGGGTSGLPAVELDPDDPEPVLTIEFLRRRDGNLIYTPQFSSDLSDWPASDPSLTVEPIDDQWERVTVQDPDGSSDPDKRFGRVEVSQP